MRSRTGTRRAGGWLRGCSGVLAGGLVVLVVALAGAAFLANRAGTPGPGSGALFWHAVAALAAVVAQRYADRHPGPDGSGAALGVVAVTTAVLAAQWLA